LKKILCLFFILLASCTTPASPSSVTTNPPSVSIRPAFVYSQECPRVCWLGISPGVTTAEEALALLVSSDQIDQHSYVKHVGEIIVEWHTEQMGVLSTRVYMDIEDGIVKRLSFAFYGLAKIREFIELMGEPDEISIWKDQTVEANCCISYVVYYTSAKSSIFAYVPTIDDNGPNEVDSIDFLYLNLSPDDSDASDLLSDHKDLRQPWLGFGHLNEYLKNRPSPSE
jgi:hypothetical protein